MANPASELLMVLDSWTVPPSGATWPARSAGVAGVTPGVASTNDVEVYRRIATAINLIQSIENLLKGLAEFDDEVGVHLDLIPRLYEAVLDPYQHWGAATAGSNERPAISTQDRQLLRGLSSYLKYAGLPDPGEIVSFEDLAEVLERSRKMIVDERGLPESVRSYLIGIIERALWVLRNQAEFGADELRALTHQLSGAMNLVADSGAVRADRASVWKKVAGWVAITVFTPPLVAVGQVGAAEIKLALPASTSVSQLGP